MVVGHQTLRWTVMPHSFGHLEGVNFVRMHFGLFGRWTALGMHFGWEWTLTRGKDWLGIETQNGVGKGPQFVDVFIRYWYSLAIFSMKLSNPVEQSHVD